MTHKRDGPKGNAKRRTKNKQTNTIRSRSNSWANLASKAKWRTESRRALRERAGERNMQRVGERERSTTIERERELL